MQSIQRRQPWYCRKDEVNLFIFFKTIEYEISEHVYKPKYKPFQKRALDCYLQGTFYTYTDNTGNKKFL